MTKELDKIAHATNKIATWQAEREAAIRNAYSDGASLRVISRYCGLSHEQVRRIVQGG